jgi:hypothetical protein
VSTADRAAGRLPRLAARVPSPSGGWPEAQRRRRCCATVKPPCSRCT